MSKKHFTITIASNQSLLAQIRGMAIRPAIRFKDRKKEANRKACRGNFKGDE
jgi:hypothetical protein